MSDVIDGHSSVIGREVRIRPLPCIRPARHGAVAVVQAITEGCDEKLHYLVKFRDRQVLHLPVWALERVKVGERG